MMRKPEELNAGMVIDDYKRGKIVIDMVTLLPTGDWEIYYHRELPAKGYGAMIVLPDTEFKEAT